LKTTTPRSLVWNIQSAAGYAKAPGVPALGKKGKGSKMPATVERRKFPVESDPEKLTKFVCGSNILKTGQDVELKPDSEYPEWLFKIRLGEREPLEEMDQETLEYWRRLRKESLRRNTKLMRLKKY